VIKQDIDIAGAPGLNQDVTNSLEVEDVNKISSAVGNISVHEETADIDDSQTELDLDVDNLDPDLDAEALLYEEEIRMDAEKAVKLPSRRLQKHGRKHKKGRDKDPYNSSDAYLGAQIGGKHGKGKKFTRRTAAWEANNK